MVVEEDSTAVEVSMVEAVAEVTMVTAAAIPTAATMAVAITVGADTMDTMVATVGTAATDGMADIGAIHTTVTAGAGDLALGGRIGVGDGDTRMATATALGITLPTVTDRYYYPQDCPPGYPCPPNGNDDPPPRNSSPKSGSNPAKPWRPPVSTPNTNYATSDVATVTPRAPLLSSDRITATVSNYRVTHATTRQNPTLRPEVQNAMRALREMPPFAREREIETGRYSHFSPEEREPLRSLN
jgi:hypothetical protein